MPKPQEKPLTTRVLKNTFFNSISRFISGLGGFIITPFILKFLGLDLFGVWTFLFVLIAYLNLLDLGFAESTVKFTAQYRAEKKPKAIFTLFTLSAIFYLILAAVLLIFYPLISLVLGKIFSYPANSPVTINNLFLIAIIFAVLTKLTNVLVSIYTGLQKMELVTLSQFIYNGFLFFFVFVVIYTRQPLFYIFYLPAIAQAITLFSNFFLIKKVLPQFQLDLSSVNKSFLKRTLCLGAGVQAGISSNILTTQIAKSLISTLGFNYLGIYELAFKAVAFLKSLPTVFLEPLFPAISELNVLDKAKRNLLIARGTKYLSFFTCPLFFLSFIFMPSLMRLWLGREIVLAIFAAQVLLIGFLPDTIIGMLSTALTGVGKVFINVEYALIILILNSFGMYYFLRFSDFKLLLYVFPITVFIGFLWKLMRFSKKVLPLGLNFYFKNMLHSGLVCLLAAGGTFVFYKNLLLGLNYILGMLIACFVFGLLYLPLLVITGFFAQEDLLLIKKVVKNLKR